LPAVEALFGTELIKAATTPDVAPQFSVGEVAGPPPR